MSTDDEDLFVSVDGRARRRWTPQQSPVRFGRSERRTEIRLCRGDQTAVSRVAGCFLWDEGLWWARNDSGTRAFSVLLDDGSAKPLATLSGVGTRFWAVSPPGATLLFPTPFGPIVVRAVTARLPPDLEPGGEDGTSGDPPTPRYPLTGSDRQLLSAKFLSRGATGPILGDQDAAALCTAHGRAVSAAAVNSAAARARDRLKFVHGVQRLEGAQNIGRLRTELLAWGYLTEEDGPWCRRPRQRDTDSDDGPTTTG